MSAQVHSVPGQTEGRSKAFLEWKSIDLSRELSLTCGANINYKSVHQPIPTRENREHPGNFQNKSVSSAFNWVLLFYFLKWNRYFSACKREFLQSTSQLSFRFCINLQCHQKWLLYTFFISNILYFGQKQPIKAQIFKIFECSGQTLSSSSCQFWTDKSIPLQILYHSSFSWHKTSL